MLQKRPQNLWLIVIALLVLFSTFLINLNEPWFGHREGASLWIGAAIRTYNRFGVEAVDFLPIRTAGPSDPETGLYYLHHPPLIVWFNAIGTWLFGYDAATGMPYESSVRLVGIFFTLPTLCLLYVVARRLTNTKSALWAFLLYGFTPMTIYFSRGPYYDMLVLPFILAFTAVFILWLRKFSLWRSLVLMLLAVVTMWVAWAGAFFLATLGAVVLLYGKKEHRLWIVGIGFVTVLATLAVPLLYETLRPGALTDLMEIFIFRSSNLEGGRDSESFTLLGFLGLWLRDMLTVVSLALTVLGSWGLIALLRKDRTAKTAISIALIIAPLVFMLVFRNAFHFHDWYKIHFMSALAIGAGWTVYRAWQVRPFGWNRFVRPLVFAIIVCSLGITVYWTNMMHQATYNTFARNLAADLPQYTDETDEIFSNITRPYSEIEYYAYRTVTWGVSESTMMTYFEDHETLDVYYVLCDEFGGIETYQGVFIEMPYELLADSCRLIHLER